mmetsp:Transcript_92415/g.164381  ORF Transcript_92415/g.164381 Transcript_92415/m.164381 type:complete len:222 (-) Transcript_92415:173-838(-)
MSRRREKLGSRCLWIAWSQREKRGLHDFFDDMPDYTLAADPEHADFVLVSGVEAIFAGTEAETRVDYERDGNHRHFRRIFRECIQYGLPMLCANPDERVVRPGGWRAYLGGSLAKLYEELGGQVQYFGKPYNACFEQARSLLCEAAGRDETDEDFRICHVGDSIHHDVSGARMVGFNAAFVVSTGLHAGIFLDGIHEAKIRQFCAKEQVPLPHCTMDRFVW